MTREEAKKYLPIIQAYIDGKQVQWLDETGRWHDANDKLLTFYSPPSNYRIKPELKYRPFKTKEECWQEMLKHQPFGWIKDVSKYVEIVGVYKNDIEFSPDEDDDGVLFRCFLTFESVLKQGYTFVDGTPFGIKEE